MIDAALLQRIAGVANLAPSVHNTQPARWHLDPDGAVLVAADLSRHLVHADPQFRDMATSCGAAVEGTVLALSELGLGVATVEDLWQADDRHTLPGHRLAARIVLNAAPQSAPTAEVMRARFTWRSAFRPVETQVGQALARWALDRSGETIVTDTSEIAYLAARADDAAMTFLRDRAFRHELLGWMRLKRGTADFDRDGMNLDALKMSWIEGKGAGLVLGTGLFEALDAIGLAKSLSGEAAKTRSASAIVLVHRPRTESAIASGRAFYRTWLDLTRLGVSAWPMAALADDPVAASDCATRYNIPDSHRLLNVLRIGAAETPNGPRARLPVPALII
jgi:hypothetical protein